MLLLLSLGRGYFYPRPPRGGRHFLLRVIGGSSSISIHALREEGDGRKEGLYRAEHISIHALREEGDSEVVLVVILPLVFLSTPSARRATAPMVSSLLDISVNFYPRPPRGGRPTTDSE